MSQPSWIQPCKLLEGVQNTITVSVLFRSQLAQGGRDKVYADSEKQNSLDEWKTIGRWLEKDGIDCIDVSTGGLLDRKPNIPVRPGYQVPYTSAMKEAVSIPVTAVGLLDNPGLCEYILKTKQADLILQGRALIRNVNWLAVPPKSFATPISKCTIIPTKEGKEGNSQFGFWRVSGIAVVCLDSIQESDWKTYITSRSYFSHNTSPPKYKNVDFLIF